MVRIRIAVGGIFDACPFKRFSDSLYGVLRSSLPYAPEACASSCRD